MSDERNDTPEPDELGAKVNGKPVGYYWSDMNDDEPLDEEQLVMAERRKHVSRMYAQGRTMRQIREEMTKLGYNRLSLDTIHRDVHAVHEWFKRCASRSIAEWIVVMLAKLDYQENECLEAWHRSKGGITKTHKTRKTTKKDDDTADTYPEAERVETSEGPGDPRFLLILQGYWDRRAELFGLIGKKAADGKVGMEAPPVKLVAGLDPVALV